MNNQRGDKLEQLRAQMELEKMELELGPFHLRCLAEELAGIEHKLLKNYTYLFPLTRSRLKKKAAQLRQEMSCRQVELAKLQERTAGWAEDWIQPDTPSSTPPIAEPRNLPGMRVCPQCHDVMPAAAHYCMHCDTALT